MQLPQGFMSQEEKHAVYRLVKSLYGLKQAPRQWNDKLTKAMLKFGFKQSDYNHSLFIQKTSKGISMVLTYVDDMLITGTVWK